MASRPSGAVLRQIHQLFQRGSVGGLSEWQLLDRYANGRDESAFEALVARHGPMVLGVCRRALNDPEAVEDAFQATFLVLVRKAGTLGPRDAVGHWLYGVARRVALRARCEAARRRSLEVPLVWAVGVARNGIEPDGNDLASVLDEELSHLPAKYRAPLVLCYLEGLSHEEAARQLRWPIGSVKGRLARARELLRGRLARRGLAPAVGLLTGTSGRAIEAAVPESLRLALLRAAAQIAAGRVISGGVSISITGLTEGVISAMFLTKLKLAATVLGGCGCLALGAWAMTDFSFGGGGKAADAKPAALENPSQRADRDQAVRDILNKPLAVQEKSSRLADMLKAIKQATTRDGNPGVPIYVDPEGLQEAGASIDSRVTIDAKADRLEAALDRALRPLKLAATVRDGILVVTSRPEATLIELRALNEKLARLEPKTSDTGRAGSTADESLTPVALLKRLETNRIRFFPDDRDKGDPEDEAKSQAILDALKKRVPMPFGNETPLEDLLAHIVEKTKGPALPEGIPIYVDPIGLQDAEKTMTSPITLNLQGVALRETLRLALDQLGLIYSVRDGLLKITSESSEDPPVPIEILADKAMRGELSIREMNDLIELFRTRGKVMQSSGRSLPLGGDMGPKPGAGGLQ